MRVRGAAVTEAGVIAARRLPVLPARPRRRPRRLAEGFVAIRDIAPKADVHPLVLPERHVDTFRDVDAFPADEAKRMLCSSRRPQRPSASRTTASSSTSGSGGSQTPSTCTGIVQAEECAGCRHELIAELEDELRDAMRERDEARCRCA